MSRGNTSSLWNGASFLLPFAFLGSVKYHRTTHFPESLPKKSLRFNMAKKYRTLLGVHGNLHKNAPLTSVLCRDQSYNHIYEIL